MPEDYWDEDIERQVDKNLSRNGLQFEEKVLAAIVIALLLLIILTTIIIF